MLERIKSNMSLPPQYFQKLVESCPDIIIAVDRQGTITFYNDGARQNLGFSPEEAMIHAGERRLRPIMMTALATVAGMIPLALAWGAGSQMLQPLAISVIGGITISMVLSLIITPAVHYYLSHEE